MSENEAVSPRSLAPLVKALPLEDAALAASFLEAPDIVDIYSASTSTFPAKHWLDTYRASFEQMAKKGSVVRGGKAALAALEKLAPDAAVTLLAYEANGQLGLFWLTEDRRPIGFAIVAPKK